MNITKEERQSIATSERISEEIREKLSKSDLKKGVDLTRLASELARRNAEKQKQK